MKRLAACRMQQQDCPAPKAPITLRVNCRSTTIASHELTNSSQHSQPSADHHKRSLTVSGLYMKLVSRFSCVDCGLIDPESCAHAKEESIRLSTQVKLKRPSRPTPTSGSDGLKKSTAPAVRRLKRIKIGPSSATVSACGVPQACHRRINETNWLQWAECSSLLSHDLGFLARWHRVELCARYCPYTSYASVLHAGKTNCAPHEFMKLDFALLPLNLKVQTCLSRQLRYLTAIIVCRNPTLP